MATQTIGTNVEVSVEGDLLTLRVRLSENHGLSMSGKTTVIATTHGTQVVAPGVMVGLNVNRKAK